MIVLMTRFVRPNSNPRVCNTCPKIISCKCDHLNMLKHMYAPLVGVWGIYVYMPNLLILILFDSDLISLADKAV